MSRPVDRKGGSNGSSGAVADLKCSCGNLLVPPPGRSMDAYSCPRCGLALSTDGGRSAANAAPASNSQSRPDALSPTAPGDLSEPPRRSPLLTRSAGQPLVTRVTVPRPPQRPSGILRMVEDEGDGQPKRSRLSGVMVLTIVGSVLLLLALVVLAMRAFR